MKNQLLLSLFAFSLLTVNIPALKAQVVAPIGSAAKATQTNTLSSFTAPAGTSRVLIVTASDASSTNIMSASFNGSPMTKQAQRTDGIAVDAIYTLSLGSSPNPTVGNIVVTSANPAHTGKFISARVFEKVDQVTPMTGIKMANVEVINNPFSSLEINSSTDDLVFDLFDNWNSNNNGITEAGSGQTIMHNSSAVNLGPGNGFAYYHTSTKPGASTVTMSWTTSNNMGGAFIHIAGNIKADGTLPVTLVSFNALVQQNDILLNWKTTDAVNFNHFEIERSADGINFVTAGNRQSLTGANDQEYYFIDANAALLYGANSKILYRLKMIDLDGSYKYSKVVQVQLEKDRNIFVISAQPNPFTDRITISFSMKEQGRVSVKLIDMAGRIVSNKQLTANKGFSTQSIEGLEKLTPGIYLLRIQNDSKVMTEKIMKQ